MLQQISLSNFKPFGERQALDMAPITLVYGPNSSGKSSVIQAIMLMKQTLAAGAAADGSLVPHGDYVALGNYKALVHRHEVERHVGLSFKFEAPPPRPDRRGRSLVPFQPFGARRAVELEYQQVPGRASSKGLRAEGSILSSVRYQAEAEQISPLDISLSLSGHFGVVSYETESTSPYVFSDRNSVDGFLRLISAGFGGMSRDGLFDRFGGLQFQLVSGLPSRVILSDDVQSTLQSLRRGEARDMEFATLASTTMGLDRLARDFRQIIDSVAYLGPLRSYPERHYVAYGGVLESVGKSGQFAPHLLQRKRHLLRVVNDWFHRFDIPYTLRIDELGDEITGGMIVLSLLDKRTSVAVAPSDVGFGIGQLLPVLVQGLFAEGRIICVEQPEIHLHPRLQGHLADFFIDSSTAGPGSNQWLIETHSEALMLRLQRRIREGKVDCKSISVVYVDAGPQGSTIKPLRLDKDGEFIDDWPHGFFEERFEDTFGGLD